MKYRMISASALPHVLSVAGNRVAFGKQGDSVEVELSPRAAERIARHGAVRFEAIAEPAPEPAPEPASETPAPEQPMAFARADLTGVPPAIPTETPPPEESGAETE